MLPFVFLSQTKTVTTDWKGTGSQWALAAMVAVGVSRTAAIAPTIAQVPSSVTRTYCQNNGGSSSENPNGICIFPSGNYYDGQLTNGVRQGNGTFLFADGSECSGTFRNNLLNGRGTCNFINGNRYEGEFQNSIIQGSGVYTFADGTQCSGTFENGQLNGKGVCTFANGNRYEGEFRNHVRQGTGVYAFADGTRCQGEFRNGQLNGKGSCSFGNGNRYEGEFRNNLRQGNGVYVMGDGTRCEGQFREGKLNGRGAVRLPMAIGMKGSLEITFDMAKGCLFLPMGRGWKGYGRMESFRRIMRRRGGRARFHRFSRKNCGDAIEGVSDVGVGKAIVCGKSDRLPIA